jgi:hypothetical protein
VSLRLVPDPPLVLWPAPGLTTFRITLAGRTHDLPLAELLDYVPST